MMEGSRLRGAPTARWLAVIGSLVTGVTGIAMAAFSLVVGEETGAGALLAASALAFGFLAVNLDRAVRSTSNERSGAAGTAGPESVGRGVCARAGSLLGQRCPHDTAGRREARTAGRRAHHPARARSAGPCGVGLLQQANQRRTEHIRTHGEEPPHRHYGQAPRVRSHPRRGHGHPAGVAGALASQNHDPVFLLALPFYVPKP